VEIWQKATLKSLFLPGGVLLFAALVVLDGGIITPSAAAVTSAYYLVFGAGVLLALRFRSTRVLLALFTLLIAHRALEFFATGRSTAAGPGHIALQVIALLLPVNFVVLSVSRERGWTVASLLPYLGLLFLESVFVSVLCRPGETYSPGFLHSALLWQSWFHSSKIPQLACFFFLGAAAVLLTRFFLYRKPGDAGLLWTLGVVFLAFQTGGIGRLATGYFVTAGLILAAAVVENSYALAYNDELTSLPARRSFNEALPRLKETYTVAVVDIDHFKSFNDTYGHETGDQVLRMVAGKLARVSGGGQAFRVGGEEFTILFAGQNLKDVLQHLEILRMEIEASSFRVRGGMDRRTVRDGMDRRKLTGRKLTRGRRPGANSDVAELFVTVSIGAADSTSRLREAEQVIQAADKALYRAKKNGRNRVETFSPQRLRAKRSIA
jgi:diguanylate cyclase (GGDEF)-like protein